VYRWISREIKWQPGNADSLLVVMDLLEEGRRGFVVLPLGARNAQRLPRVYRYDTANWSADGQSVIVSGRDPSSNQVIGRVDPTVGNFELLLDASRVGLFPRDAIQLSNGRVLAFASESPNGVVRLIDGGGNTLSASVGTAAPRLIMWNLNAQQALVVTANGQSFIVAANGTINNSSGGLVSAPVRNPNNIGANVQQSGSNIPTGVIEGSRFSAGQQVRVSNAAGLNMRVRPATVNSIVTTLDDGEFVVVLAGPFNDGQFTWWQVQSASGERGWVAGVIEGRDTISP
jgi:hypothetical protein